MNQQNGIQSPEIELHNYSQLTSNKGEKAMCIRGTASYTNGTETTEHPHEFKKNPDTELTFFTKINSKCKMQNCKAARR